VTELGPILDGLARTVDRGGAYGFRIRGVEVPPSHLVKAPAHWPSIELRVRTSVTAAPTAEYLDGDTANLNVRSGGSVFIDRIGQRATFTLSARPPAAALLHPHLAAVAAVNSFWCGRDSFHAGAFVADGGVWGLLGEKGFGKSSTLGALAGLGVSIVCDDVLVLDAGTAFAGPRSIDLRADAAERLGTGQRLGMIGERERWRMELGMIEPELPFRGWVALRWSGELSVRELRGSDRLRQLLRHRALRVPPPDRSALIDYAARPFLEFSRPHGWSSMESGLERLLAAVSC
jgi:hypothetical protein